MLAQPRLALMGELHSTLTLACACLMWYRTGTLAHSKRLCTRRTSHLAPQTANRSWNWWKGKEAEEATSAFSASGLFPTIIIHFFDLPPHTPYIPHQAFNPVRSTRDICTFIVLCEYF
jgi:hypothetical protein